MLIYAASGRGQLSAMAEARGGARAGPFPGRAVVHMHAVLKNVRTYTARA